MEDTSKHPLEMGSVSAAPHKKRLNLWFFVSIIFVILGFQAGQNQEGAWQPFAVLAAISTIVGIGELSKSMSKVNPVTLKHLSAFELAQLRLKERQRKKVLFIIWIAIFGVLMAINIKFGGIAWYWNPLEIFAIFMAGYYGLQLFYQAPERAPKQQLIENEMGWLFGEDWKDTSGPLEYTFAQDRIRKRRVVRWGFYFHSFFYITINAFNVFAMAPYLLAHSYGEPLAPVITGIQYAVSGIWTLFFISHGINAFPTSGILARREGKVGENLQSEIDNMYPSKLKNDEKSKRDVEYRVGDDGELEEVDKPKHEPDSN
jgi:hypothetical protein